MANRLQGPDGFDQFYGQQEGSRWPAIRQACAQPNRHAALSLGLQQPYYLDEASLLAAAWLQVQPGQLVLDLCAAPGGKSLAIAQSLFGLTEPGFDLSGTGQLVANERSAQRRARLRRVLQDHLPAAVLGNIDITGHDASRWGQHQTNRYHRVLLDAPCSSERHLIQNRRHLDQWSTGRSRRLSQQAYAMLLSAAQALSVGGYLVYATCAIAQAENDAVVRRALDRLQATSSKHGWQLIVEVPTPDQANLWPQWLEPCRYGGRVLPDRALGRGPLYLSRLIKQAVGQNQSQTDR